MARAPLDEHKQDWEDLARLDPLWAVLADPSRRGGRWGVEEFLRTGEDEVAALLATARSLGRPASRAAALDFGCGVGRLTRALAGRFDEVVGVDISEGMLARARELNADRPGCHFVWNDSERLAAFGDASFDLVYTTLVLQHLPNPALARSYVLELARVLRPGGLLVFRLPSAIRWRRRLQLRRRAYGLLRGLGLEPGWLYSRLGLAPLRMIAVREPEVLRWLKAAGATLLRVERGSDATAVTSSYYVTK